MNISLLGLKKSLFLQGDQDAQDDHLLGQGDLNML